ncbi:MAG: GFA family protein [Wolbachia sp.]
MNSHLCSCAICQRSSGAPTVAWVEFPLKSFEWVKDQPSLFRKEHNVASVNDAVVF